MFFTQVRYGNMGRQFQNPTQEQCNLARLSKAETFFQRTRERLIKAPSVRTSEDYDRAIIALREAQALSGCEDAGPRHDGVYSSWNIGDALWRGVNPGLQTNPSRVTFNNVMSMRVYFSWGNK